MNVKLVYQKFGKKWHLAFMALTVLAIVVVTIESLAPSDGRAQLYHIDKIAHCFAYCALGMVSLPAFARLRPLFVWGMLTLYGGIMEFTQGMMNMGRKADILDALANASGALLAVFIWLSLSMFFARKKV